MAAVHRDDEDVRPPRRVGLIAVRPLAENAVLNRDGVEFAGPHAKEGEFGSWRLRGLNREAARGLVRRPERFDGRMQETLPGLRPNGKAEQCAVVPRLQPVTSGVLPVLPTPGQVFDICDFVIDDCAVAHAGPEHRITPPRQGGDESLKATGR